MSSILTRLDSSHLVKDQYKHSERVNSLSNDKILDWFKLKAFADDKINVIKKLKCFLGRVENIVGKVFCIKTLGAYA